MADVSFDEERSLPSLSTVPQVTRTGLRGLVIKSGLAKDDAQANIVLIAVAAISVVVATYFMFSSKPYVYVPTAEEQRILDAMRSPNAPSR